MKHLKGFNESQSMYRQNEKYKELAELLQSEALDDYDIYEGHLHELMDPNTLISKVPNNYTNNSCWHFNNSGEILGQIYGINIYPKNRHTREGKETLQNILKDIELLKDRIGSYLDIEIEIELHRSFLIITISEYKA